MANRPNHDVMRVPFSGCFVWLGPITQDGYGNISGVYAHRVAWEKEYGPIPKGMNVLHRCDIRCCVNPTHLFLGTQVDNIKDMIQKRRLVSPNGWPALTDEQREDIYNRAATSSTKELSIEYRVTEKHIRRIQRGGMRKN